MRHQTLTTASPSIPQLPESEALDPSGLREGPLDPVGVLSTPCPMAQVLEPLKDRSLSRLGDKDETGSLPIQDRRLCPVHAAPKNTGAVPEYRRIRHSGGKAVQDKKDHGRNLPIFRH